MSDEQTYFFEQINNDTCKTYLFGKKDSKIITLVDPKIDYLEDYKSLIEKNGYKLKYIIDTHTHADHISAGSALKDYYGCELIMGEKAPAQCVTMWVKDGDEIDLDGVLIKILYTPGHTKDATSVLLSGKVLTGDALFLDEGGAGRDDLPGGDPGDHWESIEKLKKLPDDIMVYPTHEYRGREPSSIGNQKESNPHMKERTKEEFIAYINDLFLGPAEWMKDVLKANYDCSKDPDAAWVPKDSPSCEVMGTLQLDPDIESIEITKISPDKLKSKLDSGEDIYLIDVRSAQEFKNGKLKEIKGSENIPLTAIVNDVGQVKEKKDKEICIVCGSGKRSKIAAQIMEHSGFKNVQVLEEGLRAWYGT